MAKFCSKEIIQLIRKSKSKIVQLMLVAIVIVGVCVAGIYVVYSFTDRLDEGSVSGEADVNLVDVLGETPIELGNTINSEEYLEDEGANVASENSYVYEADYDSIIEDGEPSNAYTLFEATKNDVVPIMDEYFTGQGLKMNFETDMDNTYEMVDDEKITYYETLSMWSEKENDSEMYFISSDTVTGKLLYVGVYREDKEEAIQLIRKSLEVIDPNLTEEQLHETSSNMVNSTDYVDEICGDYEVQGGYLGEEQNLYYYYIVSLLDN
ncbi:hypothetical protein [Anaerosporobacter sp.]